MEHSGARRWLVLQRSARKRIEDHGNAPVLRVILLPPNPELAHCPFLTVAKKAQSIASWTVKRLFQTCEPL